MFIDIGSYRYIFSFVDFLAMPNNCAKCAGGVGATRQNSALTCSDCLLVYHSKCLGINIVPEFDKISGLSWKCPPCSAGVSTTDQSNNSHVSLILKKLDIMQNDMNAIKINQSEITKSLEFYGGKIDDFNIKINQFEERLKKVSSLESEMIAVKKDVGHLQQDVEYLQQQLRLNNLEINGIPEKTNENILSIMSATLSVLGFENKIIEKCHRVAHMDPNNKNPRSVIAKFYSRPDKDAILRAVRQRKGFNVSEIGFPNIDSNNKPLKIYFNDHLTPKYKTLYRKVREISKAKGYSCWTRDCRIYIQDGSGKVKLVSNEDNLKNIQ